MDPELDLLYRSLRQLCGRNDDSCEGIDPRLLARCGDELELCRRSSIRILKPGGLEWSPALERLHPPPVCLFAQGSVLNFEAPTLGVVGSRAPTTYGLDMCGRIVRPLARRGVEIWSGLARGIDQAAHVAALESAGVTRAVLGAGLLRPYPAGSEDLIRSITERGTVLSEYPPSVPARRHFFPRRNAILAALARDVFVVQAAERSGSLLTAWMALETGGTVLVMPDRVDEPLARGGLALLREGAIPVASAADIVESVGWDLPPESDAHPTDPLLRVLGDAALGAEEIALRMGQPLARSLAVIVRGEAQGVILRTPEGRYVRAR